MLYKRINFNEAIFNNVFIQRSKSLHYNSERDVQEILRILI